MLLLTYHAARMIRPMAMLMASFSSRSAEKNVLFMRTDLSGNCTVTELLERVKDTTLGAFNNLSPKAVVKAARLVKTGKTYSLGLVVDRDTRRRLTTALMTRMTRHGSVSVKVSPSVSEGAMSKRLSSVK